MLLPHSVQPRNGARKKGRCLGRGHGTGLGTTAGRGTKGQRARSGGRKGLKMFGSKAMMLSMPKLRGFKSFNKKQHTISLLQLQRLCEDGTIVSAAFLKDKGVISGRTTAKIVGVKIEKKITVQGLAVSMGAKKAIEAAGGSVIA